jgi:sugar O-acyltransferase (sialic acid O-acetyltransferase NeuD family)
VTPVNVPWTDVNSESATLVEWHVADRSPIRTGDRLADIETSKSALEIEAPGNGIVLQLIAAGQTVSVGEPIAMMFEDEASLAAYEDSRRQAAAASAGADSQVRVTARARQRAAELGVDLTAIEAAGLITEKDVERAASAHVSKPAASPSELPPTLQVEAGTQRLLIVGAGLGATQVLDILSEGESQRGVGIVDDNSSFWGRVVGNLPVVGGSDRISELWEAEAFDAVIIAISTSVDARARLRQLCQTAGVPMANVIDPRAKIATGVKMGSGNVICAFCHFGTETEIGDNNFISAFNSFDHHNVLGSDISTGPGCMTSGEVHLGDRVRLGTGIFVEPKVTIGEGSVVASGAVIVRSVPPGHAVKTKVVTTSVVPIRESG